ncbi:MAG: hypothetical protein J5935_00290 [Lachnospiraceae bacterium]|nr:hypothetical protein [Lachnospiraceae bacterium]
MKARLIAIYLLIGFFLSAVSRTDALYVAYLAVGLLAAFTAKENEENAPSLMGFKRVILYGLPALFSLGVLLSEYDGLRQILLPQDYFAARKATFVLTLCLLAAGGFIIGREILLFFFRHTGGGERSSQGKEADDQNEEGLSFKACALAFGILWGIDLLYLFLCAYPGNLTTDSLSQISQIVSGVYSDHHPYWHTRLIRVFFRLGTALAGDVNGGAACFHVFQSAVLCLSFVYVLKTLYDIGIRGWRWRLVFLSYLLLPYHILYSVTLWKDVLFAALFTIFTTAAYRYFERPVKTEGKTAWQDLLFLLLGGAGVCLLRSNGWLVFFLTTVIFLLLYRKKAWPLVPVLLCTLLMNTALLRALPVEKADSLEALALPMQQITRTVTTEDTLSTEEQDLVETLVPIEELRSAYDPALADPVKALIRQRGTLPVLEENKSAYFRLWLSLGLRHPGAYLQAFTDLTKGYWNAGYDNYLWAQGIGANELGLAVTEKSHIATALKNSYLWLFENLAFLKLIKCIGLYFWTAVFLSGALILRNRREAALILPYLFLFLTLFLATPVNNEFRYIYALPCVLPLFLGMMEEEGSENALPQK